MAPDPHQLAALEAAVDLDPQNLELRSLLHGMHLELVWGPDGSAHARRALDHLLVVHHHRPGGEDEVRTGLALARMLGDRAAIAGFEQALFKAGWSEEPSPKDVAGSVAQSSPPQAETAPAAFEPPQSPMAGGIGWRADGSHDQIDGFDPLWVRVDETDDGGVELAEVEVPNVRLADVGGLEDVKSHLYTSFLAPMRNPDLQEMYGTSMRGGLLLWGPPGCGKTFLARALAGELGTQFVSIGLHEILDMWLGQSERNLHEVFETARRNRPCVLFLDEVDALGQKRSNLRHSAGRNVVVQLLAELDGLGTHNDGVFVVGATNQPWDVDPALRRPGRFDRMVLVLPPDLPARLAILRHHLGGRPVDDRVPVEKLARATEGYSGADLRYVCEVAAQTALEDSVRTGRARPLSWADLEHAVDRVRPSTRAWFEAARNYAEFSNDGGSFDELLAYLRTHRIR